jgi:ElaB/YqjD/DUF883 family membrane-anchored ribosome-binding protein
MAHAEMEKDSKSAESLLKKTIHAGAQLAQTGVDASRVKATVDHAVEDGVAAARRLAKRGRYAVEDFVDEAEHRVKREPFRAVGIALGIGLGIGILAGWLAGRNGKV